MSALLSTFVAPRPNATLMRVLEPVNRLINLSGIPLLRDVPLLNRIPGIRGLTNITSIDFPAADLAKLKTVASPDTAAFMVLNHPEFFTDWMVDKEIMARLDIRPGCWATHNVVNGMGKWAQKFWLANNLIAQIPGRGHAGKDHSVELAKRGDGVLLHPEGTVHWVADQVGPCFPGVSDMAGRAAGELAQNGSERPVYIAPLVYKYRFLTDETDALHEALTYLEQGLGMIPSRGPLERRLGDVYQTLNARMARKYDLTVPQGPFWTRHGALARGLAGLLCRRLGMDMPQGDDFDVAEAVLRQAKRHRRGAPLRKRGPQIGKLADDLQKILRLQPWMYPGESFSQELIAECIQRLRSDWLRNRFKDRFHAFVPQPVGPRVAHIRVLDPIRVEAGCDAPAPEALRAVLQTGLDALNAEIAPQKKGAMRKNPFVA